MKRHLFAAASLVVVLLAPLGCASSGNSDGDAVYREQLGTATLMDAETMIERVFAQSGYNASRVSDPPNLRYESEWRDRSPFSDEAAEGIVAAETRLSITGRQRVDGFEGQQYFALVLMVENRVEFEDGSRSASRNTPEFVAYLEAITERFEEEMRSIGVRRY